MINMILLRKLTTITRVITLFVIVTTFGQLIKGETDSFIFGEGKFRLAAIGISSLVVYAFFEMTYRKRYKKHVDEVKRLIEADQLDEAEGKLQESETGWTGEAWSGTKETLELLSIVYTKQKKYDHALSILRALAKKDLKFMKKVDELKALIAKDKLASVEGVVSTKATKEEIGCDPLNDEVIFVQENAIKRFSLSAHMDCQVIVTNKRFIFWDRQDDQYSFRFTFEELKDANVNLNSHDIEIEIDDDKKYKVGFGEGNEYMIFEALKKQLDISKD